MNESEELWNYLTQRERDELLHLSMLEEKEAKRWKPLAGPQTQAFNSAADILFYGGSAGGGKTDYLLGSAHLQHTRSIIFRREFTQLRGIKDRAYQIYSGLGKYNKVEQLWTFFDGRQIEFGAVKDAGSEENYQGRDHDLKGFDEITHFLESQFRFLIGWNRSTKTGQRSRVICTGNPPTSAEGDWVIRFWAPWLDDKHPDPAEPGELRWFTTIDGVDTEIAGGDKFELNGEIITPKSRTFIPARIDDNPYLAESGYKSTLQGLPEPLRSKMLYGDFTAGREDDAWQVIPTEWVYAAQERWRNRKQPLTGLHSIGADIARGGRDKTILSPRYGNYFAEQLAYPGAETPDGPHVASLILPMMQQNTIANVDVIGVGSSVYDILNNSNVKVCGLNSAAASDAKDRLDFFGFANKRAEWWWKFRESLDPEHGDELAIPDDQELLSDLCAPRYKITTRGVLVEPKLDIIKRIGRSPDRGDSLVYAHAQEETEISFGSF